MAWVADISLNRPAVWGLSSALPRAVPSDAATGLIDEAIPAGLLQKAILVGVLGGACAGMLRLLRETGPVAQLASASLFVWNPFVAERLSLVRWPLLLPYAAIPWLILDVRRETVSTSVLALAVKRRCRQCADSGFGGRWHRLLISVRPEVSVGVGTTWHEGGH